MNRLIFISFLFLTVFCQGSPLLLHIQNDLDESIEMTSVLCHIGVNQRYFYIGSVADKSSSPVIMIPGNTDSMVINLIVDGGVKFYSLNLPENRKGKVLRLDVSSNPKLVAIDLLPPNIPFNAITLDVDPLVCYGPTSSFDKSRSMSDEKIRHHLSQIKVPESFNRDFLILSYVKGYEYGLLSKPIYRPRVDADKILFIMGFFWDRKSLEKGSSTMGVFIHRR